MEIASKDTVFEALRGQYLGQYGGARYVFDAIASLRQFTPSSLFADVEERLRMASIDFREKGNAPRPPILNCSDISEILDYLCRFDGLVQSVRQDGSFAYKATDRFLCYHRTMSEYYDSLKWVR